MTECCTLGTLTTFLVRREKHSKLRRLAYQAAQGLAHLHENGVVHGALMCNNMLIGETTNEPTVKLSNFGYRRIRKLSVGDMTQNEQSSGFSDACWTALECLLVTDGGGKSL